MHLFDIDVPGGIRFQESEVLSPGSDLLTFDTGEFIVHYSSWISNAACSSLSKRVVQGWCWHLL